MQIYHLHPAAVHFPIAFLVAAVVAQALGVAWPRLRPAGAADRAVRFAAASSWLLGTGTVLLWIAVALGLVAERTAPHVPPAWEVLYEHRTLGLWSAGLFTVLAVGRLMLRGRFALVQLLLGLVGLGLLLSTAYHGGELVFMFGMGVTSH